MPTTPDPSRVYGYITLVDPDTNQKHRPLNSYDARGNAVPDGFPMTIDVFFRGIDGHLVSVGLTPTGGTGGRGLLLHQDCIKYDFQLNQIRGMVGNPQLAFSILNTGWQFGYCTIAYDPDRFSFDHVAMGNYRFADPSGTVVSGGYRFTDVPLQATATPFTDLPDFSPLLH